MCRSRKAIGSSSFTRAMSDRVSGASHLTKSRLRSSPIPLGRRPTPPSGPVLRDALPPRDRVVAVDVVDGDEGDLETLEHVEMAPERDAAEQDLARHLPLDLLAVDVRVHHHVGATVRPAGEGGGHRHDRAPLRRAADDPRAEPIAVGQLLKRFHERQHLVQPRAATESARLGGREGPIPRRKKGRAVLSR